VAIAIALLGLVGMLVSPVAGLLTATVYGAFAWGIKTRQRWAAVGWLVFLLLPIPFAAYLRDQGWGQIIVFAILQLGIAALVAEAAVELWRDEMASRLAWPWAIGVVGLLAFLVCLHPYYFPTASMEPTILQGDYFLTRTRFLGTPQRGELIVYRYPTNPKEIFVKRVVGIPGDRLRIVNKQLYRNGAPVAEPYAVHEAEYIDDYRDNFPSEPNAHLPDSGRQMLANDVRNGELVVPAGNYFVLGDNRDDSLDSRYHGFVPQENIIGRPWLIYASYGAHGERVPRTAFNTRWNRLFKVL